MSAVDRFLHLELRIAQVLAATMLLTGCAWLLAPSLMFASVSTEAATPTAHALFASNGLFLAILGAALLHALRQRAALPVLLLWISIEKLAYAALLLWQVNEGGFSSRVVSMAAFDGIAALLLLDLRRRWLSSVSP